MKNFLLSFLFFLLCVLSYGQDKLFTPYNQIFPTTGGKGIGVNKDKPEAAMHIVEFKDKGVGLRIDLVEEDIGIPGGGMTTTNPEYAFRIKRFLWNISPNEVDLFSIDGRGNTRIGYNGITNGERLSIGGNAGIFYNAANKINLSFSGTQPEISWQTSSNKNLRFKNTNNSKTPLSLSPNGKVGINTEDFSGDHDLYVNGSVYLKGDSPEAHSLYIEGSTIAEEIFVKVKADWPDYVFADHYELMPLKELGDFIDKNGHLPNMPTADKVKEEGIAAGETIRLLTEKVEQLTLYILQQQREIEALKEEIIKK